MGMILSLPSRETPIKPLDVSAASQQLVSLKPKWWVSHVDFGEWALNESFSCSQYGRDTEKSGLGDPEEVMLLREEQYGRARCPGLVCPGRRWSRSGMQVWCIGAGVVLSQPCHTAARPTRCLGRAEHLAAATEPTPVQLRAHRYACVPPISPAAGEKRLAGWGLRTAAWTQPGWCWANERGDPGCSLTARRGCPRCSLQSAWCQDRSSVQPQAQQTHGPPAMMLTRVQPPHSPLCQPGAPRPTHQASCTRPLLLLVGLRRSDRSQAFPLPGCHHHTTITGHQQLPACRHRTETGWEKLQAMSLNKHPGAADSPAVSKQHLVADVSVTWLVKYSLMSAQICITCGTDSRTRGVIGTVKLHCAGHCRCQTCCALPVKHTKTKA